MLNQLQSATVVASDYSGVGYYVWMTNANDMGWSNGYFQDETLIGDYLSGGTWNYSDNYGMAGSWVMPSVEDGINSYGWLFSPTFEYAALDDANYRRIVQTKVMIVPQGMVPLATTQPTQTYLVLASAASFSRPILPGSREDFYNHDYFFNFINVGIWSQQWYAGNVPLPPEWFQINGQTLVNSGIINSSDGSVWGLTVVSAPSGATVDVTPTMTHAMTNNDYTFRVEVGRLQIVDANTGTILTTQTNTVIVGQQMNLKCQLMVSNEVVTSLPLANFQWTVPGYAISNYVVATDSSSAMVVTNFPLNNSNVVFYWVDGATNRVIQCSATVQCKTITGQAVFNVLRPTAKVMTQTSSVELGYNINRTFFGVCFGTNGGAPGILFSNTVIMPLGNYNYGNANYILEWVQVVTPTYLATVKFQGTNIITYTKMATNVVLDTTYPYGFDPSFPYPDTDDSPCIATDLPQEIAASVTQNSEMWLMFQPANGQSVPLRTVSWNCSGAATNSGAGWVLTSRSWSTNPSDADAGTTYPVWTNNISTIPFQ
ncbi:MAG: hypothetical protein ABSH15_09065 [Verrucomicrobiota bacterium]